MDKQANFLDIKGLELYDSEIKKYIKRNQGGNSLFTNGEGENSIQATDMNSKAIGDYSIAIGYDSVSGCKGFYIKAIDATNKYIYLQMEAYDSTEKPVFLSPEEINSEPNPDYFDSSFSGYDNIDFESGEEYYCCMKNHFAYTYKCKIVNVNKNCLTYEGELGFTEFLDNTTTVNYSFWIPKYSPEQGAFTIGNTSYTEGFETIASNDCSHAEGWATIAAGKFSHAEGNRTVAGGSAHAEGQNTRALGENSHAEGSQTTAYANMSHAEGYQTNANGGYSHAEGKQTTTENDASHAEGNGTKALGYQSHAEGYQTTASGNSSHAEGSYAQATSQNSHAEGTSTVANGRGAHAEGDNTIAKGNNSHAEGQGSHANGEGAHAEGLATIANGKHSHAEGYNTTADKDYSHAEGDSTTASGYRAHAEGYKTIASGRESHAEGYLTVAQSGYQHVQGKCNIIDKNNKYAHIVGNGTDENNRSNAHTLDWNGNAWFAGEVIVGSGNEKLVTESEVESIIYQTPITEPPTTLQSNQKYNFGEQENLSIAFPTNAKDGDVVYLTFNSGAIPTTLTIDTTNTTDIEIIPEANCYYEIFGSFNGSIWLVNYSEYLVSEV